MPSISIKIELSRCFIGKSGCGEPKVTKSISFFIVIGKKHKKTISIAAKKTPFT